MYQYKDGGLRNVWLANGYTVSKTKYGNAVAFDNAEGLTQAVCLALTKKASALTGAELRYIRQGLLMSQASLGKLLGCTSQSVALWEKGKQRIPKAADIALRVIYTSHTNGNERIKNIVTALNESERFMLVMRETRSGWQASQQPVNEALAKL